MLTIHEKNAEPTARTSASGKVFFVCRLVWLFLSEFLLVGFSVSALID
jgi:hypothetical protein